MDKDIDPKILEEIRRLSLSSDVKFNRFFGDLTPETKNVLETIIRHYIPGVLKTTEFNQNRPLILTKRNITDFNQNMAECSRNTIISLSSAI